MQNLVVTNTSCRDFGDLSMGHNLFTKRERSLIFSALKKSSFLKSTLLPNFAFDDLYTGNK